jgi:hypothetical protein
MSGGGCYTSGCGDEESIYTCQSGDVTRLAEGINNYGTITFSFKYITQGNHNARLSPLIILILESTEYDKTS